MTTIAGLSCSLPVAVYNADLHGAFVNFPAAQFHDDGGESQLRFGSGDLVTTVTKPVLDGGIWSGPVWDWQQHRWLPALNSYIVAPDGSAYVYMQDNGPGGAIFPTRLRIVQVSNGSDQLLPSNSPYDMPIAWTKDGIYIVTREFEGSSVGLRLINPSTGAEKVITANGSWLFVANGAAWGLTPPIGGPTAPRPHVVDRLDLATGKVTLWYSAPDPHNVHVAALDLLGRPIIVVDDYHVFRLVGPNQAQPLFNSPVLLWDGTTPQVDVHGFWFVTPWYENPAAGEVWLYSDTTGLKKVAETGKDILNIAGPCR